MKTPTDYPSRIEIGPIKGDEQLELMEHIDDNLLKFESRPAGATKMGEPITVAVIVLGGLAVNGLAAYLLKKRRANKVHVGYLKLESGAFTIEVKDFEFEARAEEEPTPALIKALTGSLTGAVSSALSGGK